MPGSGDQHDEAGGDHTREVVRVVIADDHPLVFDGIEARLARDPNIEVVAAAKNGEELVRAYARLHPDVVLCDYSMPGITGWTRPARSLRTIPMHGSSF